MDTTGGARQRARRSPSKRQIADAARARAAIVEAALEVFSEKGYTATTLETIGRLVGLTRQGVLHHFSTKEELFAAVISDQDRWAREFYSRATKSGDEGLHGLNPFLRPDDPARRRLQMAQVLQGEAMSGTGAAHTFTDQRLRRMRSEIAARVERTRADGRMRSDADPRTIAVLVAAVISGLQAQALIDDEIDPEAALALLVELLATPPSDE